MSTALTAAKLHSEIAEFNKLGVRVRYVFYPRTGPGTESWHKAEAVWCSANRNEALTQAKAGATMDLTKLCADAGGAGIRTRPEHRRARHAGDRHRGRRLHRRVHAAASNCCSSSRRCRSRSAALAFEQLQLVLDAFPLLGVGGRHPSFR
jgi:hypothetical protein